MFDYLSGIIFLGTPHQGSTSSYIARPADVVGMRKIKGRLSEHGSKFPFTTAGSFERFLKANTLEVKSFYETEITRYRRVFFQKKSLVSELIMIA
jgi:hypothetical protein